MNSNQARLWQRRPFAFGCLVILGLFFLFLLFVFLFLRRAPMEADASQFSFAFKDQVAVIKIEGVITESENILRLLRRYRKSRSVKALVLRVNSPGGAVAPSQEIYLELKRFGEKKPVVCSMSSVAASGGYYVCLGCNYIISAPGTVTGSIGVLMQVLDLEELLRWMKIRQQVIKSGKFKDAGSPYRPLTPEEKKYFQKVIDNVHNQFKKALAESRGLKEEEIEKIADGRILTGEQALELGLVDALGNLEDAIKKAGELAGIKGEPEVIFPRTRFSFWESMGTKLARGLVEHFTSWAFNPVWYLEPGIKLSSQTRSEQ